MTDRQALIAELLIAWNEQDFAAAQRLLHPRVDWRDLMNGGRLSGPAAVRDYWHGVYSLVTSGSSIVETRLLGEDRVVVKILHSIRDKQGRLWSEEAVTQVFTFKDGLIIRMDVDEGG